MKKFYITLEVHLINKAEAGLNLGFRYTVEEEAEELSSVLGKVLTREKASLESKYTQYHTEVTLGSAMYFNEHNTRIDAF